MVKCKVLLPHSRYIGKQLVMYEPMLSGIVDVPDDDQTLAAIEAKYLEPVEAAEKEKTG